MAGQRGSLKTTEEILSQRWQQVKRNVASEVLPSPAGDGVPGRSRKPNYRHDRPGHSPSPAPFRPRDVSCDLAPKIPRPPASSGDARRHLPVLLTLFAGSGCSALIYEIVWYQLLQLVIGSSAVSLGVLLATFMGGLCLGSLLLPRLKLGGQHPLRVYGMLELGIGACGILVLLLMPLVD